MNKKIMQPGFPHSRLRRLRQNPAIRNMLSETSLSVKDFIYPIFAVSGKGIRKEIPSMPGIFQLSTENAVKECEEAYKLGIPSVILFGIPDLKDETGSGAYDKHGVIQNTIRSIKKEVPELIITTDVCLCEYTTHGHCGVIENGEVNNDKTLELLVKEALSHAEAGVDIIAPSDM